MPEKARRTGAVPVIALVATGAGLSAGAAAAWAGSAGVAAIVWAVVTALAVLPAGWSVIDGLRHRRFGADVIAVLALGGTLAVGAYLAGAVIAVMFTGGQALEARAERRAHRDLSTLISRAPTIAYRRTPAGIATIGADEVRPGDTLIVRGGDVLPVDGVVAEAAMTVDESVLTGEPLPIERAAGERVRSGTLNVGGPAAIRATTTVAGGAYAGVVRLARAAAVDRAPFVRTADRYAALFVPLTLAIGLAAWLFSGDPVRGVAVLVIATPCPLILAAPIAFVSGLSRASRRGVVVKGGAALDALGRAEVLLIDKTGTVTMGAPALTDVVAPAGVAADEVLRLAASLDQVSTHVLAAAIVAAARARGAALSSPADVADEPGTGLRGRVDGTAVTVGKAAMVPGAAPGWVGSVRRRAAATAAITVFVSAGGRLVGALLLEDRVRADAPRTFRLLRRAGIRRLVMITGDRADAAAPVGELIGADAIAADRSPAGKVDVVRAETAHTTTVMTGDGINDAPALAAATVGVALGARGATAASDIADAVILVDRLDRLAETMMIARRTRTIARQSVLAGMALSLAGMFAAATGHLVPAVGAVAQEAIDVAVILNALRALGAGPGRARTAHGDTADLIHRLDDEHRRLRPGIAELARAADGLDTLPDRDARLADLTRFLNDELLPHERADERLLYPAIAGTLGGTDPTATMSREHVEITELVRRVTLLTGELAEHDGPVRTDVLTDLRRALYELHAVLRLHFAQEEEDYHALADGAGT
jgi:heavy metal translocating P-type ATPase